ncbi:energy transducer TonB [Chromobacterium alkanivorans]|uniref:energy transducer TonB n=1 Tax=Chromobacterium alkanivorans TaxID=1071719 RepID=UPI0019674A22|nr:energy transducer TonB [Chromobacterium alkanivorans]MBN3003608.1 energy transducer TonB [Chromobacterium alkanivorans]
MAVAAWDRPPQPLASWGNACLLTLGAPLLALRLYLSVAEPVSAPAAPAAVMRVWAAEVSAAPSSRPLPTGAQQSLAAAASRPKAARRPEPLPKLAEAEAPRLLAARRSREQPADKAEARDSEQTSQSALAASSSAAPRADAGDATAAPFNSEGAARAMKQSWEGRVQSHLARFRRYPEDASRRRRDGVVKMSFVVDADGRVLSSQQLAGSGTASLDREAAAMLQRAQPLPAPPADLLKGGRVSVSLPMRFELSEI